MVIFAGLTSRVKAKLNKLNAVFRNAYGLPLHLCLFDQNSLNDYSNNCDFQQKSPIKSQICKYFILQARGTFGIRLEMTSFCACVDKVSWRRKRNILHKIDKYVPF